MDIESIRTMDFFTEAHNRSLKSSYPILKTEEGEIIKENALAIVTCASMLNDTLLAIHDSIVEEIRKVESDK